MNGLTDFSKMLFDFFFARFYEGFEANQFSALMFSRMSFSNGKLSDCKAEKVEAYLSFYCFKRVRNLGFAGF